MTQPGKNRGSVSLPRTVHTSFQLWIASAFVALVAEVLLYLTLDERIRAEVQRQSELPGVAAMPSQIELTMSGDARVALLFALGFVAVLVYIAVVMRRGRNWARVMLTALGGVRVVSRLPLLGNDLLAFVAVLEIALIVAAIVFMFRPSANAYIAAPG